MCLSERDECAFAVLISVELSSTEIACLCSCGTDGCAVAVLVSLELSETTLCALLKTRETHPCGGNRMEVLGDICAGTRWACMCCRPQYSRYARILWVLTFHFAGTSRPRASQGTAVSYGCTTFRRCRRYQLTGNRRLLYSTYIQTTGDADNKELRWNAPR